METKEFNNAPPGTLFATDPPGGTKVKKGAKVKLLVSVGQPQVVFTNGKDVLRVNGATTKKLDPIAAGPQEETNPTWSEDGSHVAYVADGQIMLKDITKKDAPAVELTPSGQDNSNLAWGPTADVNVLAFSRVVGKDTDLCLGKIDAKGMKDACIKDPDFSITRAIHWTKNGREIYATAGKNDFSAIGIVRYRVKDKRPSFSTDPSDWTHGHFVSDISRKGKAMIDAALSPDGKTLAMISNQGAQAFRLWLGKPGDFKLSSAKQTAARACKLAWRGDSKEIMLVQSDAACQEDVGELVRLEINATRSQQEINSVGDDPVFQPLTLGG